MRTVPLLLDIDLKVASFQTSINRTYVKEYHCMFIDLFRNISAITKDLCVSSAIFFLLSEKHDYKTSLAVFSGE